MVELLEGHPSLLTTKVMKRYRDHLGDRYTELKKSVILLISSKRQTNNFLSGSSSSAQKTENPQTEIFDEDSHNASSIVPVRVEKVEKLHGSLQTEVRIATPTVIFEGLESQNAPTVSKSSISHYLFVYYRLISKFIEYRV